MLYKCSVYTCMYIVLYWLCTCASMILSTCHAVHMHPSVYEHTVSTTCIPPTGKPLYPGTSTMNQLDRIMSTLPPPSLSDVESIHSPYAHAVLEKIVQRYTHHFSYLHVHVNHAHYRRHKSLADTIPQADDITLDLATRLLRFNPDKRNTASHCLTHPFVVR